MSEKVGSAESDQRSGCRRVGEMALVGVVLLVIVVPLAAYSASAAVPIGDVITWVGLFTTTALVCGYTVREQRERWADPLLWAVLLAFVATQTAVGARVVSAGVRVRAAVWPTVFFPELLGLNLMIDWLLGGRTLARRRPTEQGAKTLVAGPRGRRTRR